MEQLYMQVCHFQRYNLVFNDFSPFLLILSRLMLERLLAKRRPNLVRWTMAYQIEIHSSLSKKASLWAQPSESFFFKTEAQFKLV